MSLIFRGIFWFGLFGLPGICSAEVLSIPVLLHPVQSGQEITKGDFASREYEVSDTAKENFVVASGQLVGAVALKSLPAGRPIPLTAIGAPPTVLKGKSVPVRFVQDGIEITGVLLPTQDGHVGDTIPCRNPGSGLVVNAEVLSDGTLSVAGR